MRLLRHSVTIARTQVFTGFMTSGGNSSGSLWRVVDVTMTSASACNLAPLRPRGAMAGYCVATNTDRTYDGACSR